MSELAVFGYRHALKGLTVEELERGCEKALSECSFIPKAADILRYAKIISYADYYIPQSEERTEPEPKGCELCRGTRWKLVPNGQGGQWATLCDCRKKATP